MQLTLAKAEFRPVTLVIETQDELDQLLTIIGAVADNRINHGVRVVEAACRIHDDITKTLEALQGA